MTPRWRAGLPLSIALHGALVVLALAVVRVERTPTGLMVDLSAIVVGREDGASRSSGAPAQPPVTTGAPAKSPGSSPPARVTSPSREPRESASAPATQPPAETATPRREEPTPSAVGDTVLPPPAAASSDSSSSIALTTTPDGANGAGGSAHSAAPGGATPRAGGSSSGGVASEAGAAGTGGVGTDRTAALGIPGGGGVDSDYAAYYARLRQRIQDVIRHRYPPLARHRGVTGTVHLEIAVEPNGAIGAVSVITSSSHDILDRAAVAAAHAVRRVPFPGDVRPRALRVRLPVVFELQ
jgi:protein TonB